MITYIKVNLLIFKNNPKCLFFHPVAYEQYKLFTQHQNDNEHSHDVKHWTIQGSDARFFTIQFHMEYFENEVTFQIIHGFGHKAY